MSPGRFPQEDLSADWGRRRGRARRTGWGGPDLYCQSRERDSDSEGGGQIKREKKPQSPWTPCLTPVIHWDTSFWPALIHDCSARQLSTNQHAESPLTATRSTAIICLGDKLSCLKSIFHLLKKSSSCRSKWRDCGILIHKAIHKAILSNSHTVYHNTATWDQAWWTSQWKHCKV